jgi:hypothetical protein
LRFDRRVWAPPQGRVSTACTPRFSPQMSGPSSEAAVSHVRASAVGVEDGPQRRGQCSEVAVVDTAVLHLVGQLVEKRRPVPSRGRDRHAHLDPTLDHFHSRPPGGRSTALLPRATSAADRAPLRDGPPRAWRDDTAAPGAGRSGCPPGTPISRCARRHVRLRGLVGGPSSHGPLATMSFGLTSASSVVGAPSNCHALSVRGNLLIPVRRVPRPLVHEVCAT